MRIAKLKLKRELGLLKVTLAGIGIILGAGIYVLVGKAAGVTGNTVWLSFLFGALVAAFTGLSYAELSTIFPKAGAEYVYTKHAFGRKAAYMIGWAIILSGIFVAATVSIGFAGYFASIIGGSVVAIAVVLLLVLTFINFYGVKQSAWMGALFTLIEGGGLILIIFIGLPYVGSVDYFQMTNGLGGVLSAGALIFFAFLGFEEIVRLSEETKNPHKTIPRALVISIIVTTVLYVLVAIVAVSVVNHEALAASSSPLADVASAALGNEAFFMLSIIALFSTANTVLLSIMATSRIMYGMAEFRSLPNVFGRLHKSRRTPYIALAALFIVSSVVIALTDIRLAAEVSDFFLFMTFILVNAVAIALRYKMPDAKRRFKIPLNIGKFPVLSLLGVISSLLLMFSLSYNIVLYGFAAMLIGALLYGAMKFSKIIN